MNETVLISPSQSSSTLALIRATEILNERQTRFASGMERDRSNLSRSIRHQEIFDPQPGNFGGMDCAPYNPSNLFARVRLV